MNFTKYLMLPKEITPFEQRYLKRLNKIALIFFYLHIPALMASRGPANTRPLFALVFTLVVMIGPTIAYRTIANPRALSVVYGITAMLMGGLLVHFGQGPVQIEMHFYFFALLAMLCMFANPTVNLAAAVTVALHHLWSGGSFPAASSTTTRNGGWFWCTRPSSCWRPSPRATSRASSSTTSSAWSGSSRRAPRPSTRSSATCA